MNYLKNALKQTIIFLAIYVLAIVLFTLLLIVATKSVVFAPEYAYAEEKNPILEKLAMCESGLNLLAIHYNDGAVGVNSYGKYQWQLESAWYYNQKYKVLPNIEKHEMINVIYDETFQDHLTELVLSEKGGYRNWLNCSKKLGIK